MIFTACTSETLCKVCVIQTTVHIRQLPFLVESVLLLRQPSIICEPKNYSTRATVLSYVASSKYTENLLNSLPPHKNCTTDYAPCLPAHDACMGPQHCNNPTLKSHNNYNIHSKPSEPNSLFPFLSLSLKATDANEQNSITFAIAGFLMQPILVLTNRGQTTLIPDSTKNLYENKNFNKLPSKKDLAKDICCRLFSTLRVTLLYCVTRKRCLRLKRSRNDIRNC
ncbi:hypothetical protein Pelo_14778 [Pelomyxa schiedti]|nr:hypothetical protein Pelo_14778 [Pelomyxa schiedti]